jgi:hypothetical protein
MKEVAGLEVEAGQIIVAWINYGVVYKCRAVIFDEFAMPFLLHRKPAVLECEFLHRLLDFILVRIIR